MLSHNECEYVTSVNMTPVQNKGQMNDIAVNETLEAALAVLSCMCLLMGSLQTYVVLKIHLQKNFKHIHSFYRTQVSLGSDLWV